VMSAHFQWGAARYYLGLFPAARADLERALEHYSSQGSDEEDINQLSAPVSFILSRALWMLGFCDQARKRSLESLEVSKLLRDPFALATANAFGSDVHYYCGEVDVVDERVKAVQRLLESMESEYPQLIGWTRMLEGWVMAERGQSQEGLGVTREGYDLILASGQRIAISIFGCLMADMLSRIDQVDKALETIDRTAKVAEETGQHYSDSELQRLRGEFLLMRGHRNAPEAEGCFRTAIEIARRRSAKSWELRATISLARLSAKQGRREEGRAMLAHIYNWFTEGFDTADLKEAKALLDELGGTGE
jgi:tetratricopeptide (TPR) repeat protein